MRKIFIMFLFTLASFHYAVADEQSKDRESNTSPIENIRNMIQDVSSMTKAEKEDFFEENGFTQEYLDHLKGYSELDWKFEGTHKIPQSNSTITLPEGYSLLIGKDARSTFVDLDESQSEDVEARVYDNNDFDYYLVFSNEKIGYIPIDDWNELDPDALLNEISKNTEAHNIELRKLGLNELHVVGWIQKPTLDKKNDTVYWAIEAKSGDEGSIVNSIAIKLGREGFEKLIWVTSKSEYVPFGGLLDTMLKAHSFDEGYGYHDYTVGDKLAGFGIAALVAGTIGGKILKAGGFLIIFKKVIGYIIAGLCGLLYKFKNRIFGKKSESKA